MENAAPVRLVARRARHDDYNEVMAIDDNVYDGFDYLPTSFHYFIDDPNAHCFVLEYDGKIVCFMAMQLVDGGNTVVTFAARVHPAYRRLGLLDRTIDVYVPQFAQWLKDVSTNAFVTTYNESIKKILPQWQAQTKVKLLYIMNTKILPVRSLRTWAFSKETACPLTPEQIRLTLNDPDTQLNVIRSSTLLCHSHMHPIEILDVNMEEIIAENVFFAAFNTRDSPKCISLSLGPRHPLVNARGETYYMIKVYVAQEACTMGDVINHMIKQVANQINLGHIIDYVILLFSEDISPQSCQKELRKRGFEGVSEHPISKLAVYRAPLYGRNLNKL